MTCRVEECDKPIRSLGLCALHYMRFWRNGTTEIVLKRKDRLVHSAGYILLSKPDHPLADSSGYVYEHRFVFYERSGDGPFQCHWCPAIVTWDDLHIDHLDESKDNNAPNNLVASCPVCNQKRGYEKCKETWRKKHGVEYNGKIYTMNELAAISPVSRPSLVRRLKTMSVKEAVETPRGPTGPKATETTPTGESHHWPN